MTRNVTVVAWGLRGCGGRRFTAEGYREVFGGEGNVLYLGGGGSYWNTFVKSCQTVHSNWVHFIEYKLYPYKVDLKFKIHMNNSYVDIPESIGHPLNHLISSIVISA